MRAPPMTITYTLRSGHWHLLPVMCVDTGRALEGHTSVTQTVVTRLEVGVRQGSWGTLESNLKLPSGLVIPKHLISSISSFKIHFLWNDCRLGLMSSLQKKNEWALNQLWLKIP